MRLLTITVLALTCVISGSAQQAAKIAIPKRYGVSLDMARYPQSTPQEALSSILQTIEGGRFHYLLAHLADPEFVDKRVQEYKSAFPRNSEEGKGVLALDRLVGEIKAHLEADPSLVKELYRLAKQGEWLVADDQASVRLKSSPERGAFFQKVQDRWFLLNRQSEAAPDKKGG